jgi:alpha-tubulin suppressor-like RCC1 family protein
MFVKSDGSLWAMGDNSHGQLGIFSFNSNPNPTPVHSLASGVTAIACGNGFGLFVENDGSLWSMGAGFAGQLGNNATSDINLPQNVASGVTAVAAGDSTSLFIKSDGSLWVMGLNSQGQLGDFGDFQNVDVPEQIVTVPPPQVGIATYGNQAIVFFPLNSASNYVLQTSGSLTGGNWVACTNQIPMAALLITNAGNAFFRLH